MNNEVWRIKVRCLVALAFLPVDDVRNAFSNIRNSIDEGLEIFDYFDETYIHGKLVASLEMDLSNGDHLYFLLPSGMCSIE